MDIMELAKFIGLKIVLVTTNKENILPGIDLLIPIGGKSKITMQGEDSLPLGSYFEINSMVFLDSIVAKLISQYPVFKRNIEEFGEYYKKDQVIVI